jgi:hypothetical protein
MKPRRVVIAASVDFQEVSDERADARRRDIVRRVTLTLPDGAAVQSRVLTVSEDGETDVIASPVDRAKPKPQLAAARKRTKRDWSIKGMRASQAAVLDAIKRLGPLTDEELGQVYRQHSEGHGWPRQSESGLRTRRKELVTAGLVEASGHQQTLSGRKAALWKAQ